MNWIRLYVDEIDKGLIVGKKVERIYRRLLQEIDEGKYILDEALGERPIRFAETFCVPKDSKTGQPITLDLFQKAFIQASFGILTHDGKRRFKEILLLVARKNGKALSLDTDIPTPNGFVKMKDLEVGDFVYGKDGKPTMINYVSPTFINHDCYEVEFEDGEKIVADKEHLWSVKDKRRGMIIKTTEELSKHYMRVRRDGKGNEYLYRVPMNNPIEYARQELAVNPYLLGVWLGDGESAGTRITCSDLDMDEMKSLISQYGYDAKSVSNKNRTGSIKVCTVKKGMSNPFRDSLRSIGVFNNKHIPTVYLHSSIEQRMELLRGLMDTDGYCDKAGQCEFCQKDYDFILQFSELLASLGIKHSIRQKKIMCNGKECKAYSVLFYCDKTNSCFKMKRKHDRLKDSLNDRMSYKSIVRIIKVDSVPTKCIAVDNNDHLYLAGRRMTVTHNTTLLAIIMLYMLVADGENGAECYVVATKLEQSRKTFIECQAIVSKSPELRALLKKRQSDIFNPKTFGFLKALASDSSTLDGLNSHLVTIDELHEIKEKQLYEVMKQSTSSRDEPMLFMITTAGTRRASIFDEIYKYANDVLDGTVEDDRFLPVLYEMDERLEYLDASMWPKANPGLGTIKKIEYLQEAVERAKNDASRQSGVLTKDFNLLGVTDTAWLPFDVINNEATYEMSEIEDSYAIGGADLSSTTDLTCATLLVIKNSIKYVAQMYFIPSDRLQEKIKEDGVRYDLWEERGLVRVCEGAKVNYSDVTAWFVEMREKHKIYPLWIGYDRWNANYWVDEMKGNGFNMEDVIQGAITMSNPMKELNADLIQKKLNYGNNPILKWCFTNTSIKVDDNENIRPVKGRQQKKRIDGVVSLIDAYVVYMRHIDDYSNMQS